MGKKSSKAPDVVGAATTEGEFARETARDANYANRPDQYNAFGQNTWGQETAIDPASGEEVTKWTQRQSFAPEVQRLFDSQMGRNQNLAEGSANLTNRAVNDLSAPADFDQFGDVQSFNYDPNAYRQAAEDAAYGRATQRLDPRFDKQRATLETQLANRGLRAGDQAYDAAMQNHGLARNDAYEMAQMGAVGEGRQEANQAFNMNLQGNERSNALRQQQIQEYLGKRSQSLTDANALQGAQNVGEVTQNFGGS